MSVPVYRRPYLWLLGPVALEADGVEPDPSRKARLVELAAYLAAGPRPITRAGVDDAIWPERRYSDNGTTRWAAVSRLRKWLGVDEEGRPWLSMMVLNARIDTDMHHFYRLARIEGSRLRPSMAPSRLSEVDPGSLVEALSLVRGRPLYGVPVNRYHWADRLRVELELDIAAVAAHVAQHAPSATDRYRAAAIHAEMLPDVA